MHVTIRTKYMKNGVYFFLAAFVVMGLLLLGVGIWAFLGVADMTELLNDKIIYNSAILLMVSGGLTLVMAVVGVGAVRFEKRKLLVWISISIIVVFILEMAGGFYAFANRKDVRRQLQSGIHNTISTVYGGNSPKSRKVAAAMDWIQQNVECCGGVSANDWKNSSWYKLSSREGGGNVIVPASCCKEDIQGCNQGKHASALIMRKSIFKQGCLAPSDVYIKKHFKHVGRIGIAVGFTQLIGVLLVYGLSRKLKSRERRKAESKASSTPNEHVSVFPPPTDPTPLLHQPTNQNIELNRSLNEELRQKLNVPVSHQPTLPVYPGYHQPPMYPIQQHPVPSYAPHHPQQVRYPIPSAPPPYGP